MKGTNAIQKYVCQPAEENWEYVIIIHGRLMVGSNLNKKIYYMLQKQKKQWFIS